METDVRAELGLKHRYEFTMLLDVTNGNPNGDPDAGNMPRIDPETGHGIITDVCIKRKIRDYIETVHENEAGYRIYIKDGVPLAKTDKQAMEKVVGADWEKKEFKKSDNDIDVKLRDFMCSNFFDIRAFGAVMTTFVKKKLSCGQVNGPVQICFGSSIDPIVRQDITITRVVATTEDDFEKKDTEMGSKTIVPYGLYRVDGYISAAAANKTTHFNEDDLEVLWDAMINMYEINHSAARGKMGVRKLIVFQHDTIFGNASAEELFGLVKVSRKEDVVVARRFEDYIVDIDSENKCPDSVKIIVKK